MGETSRSETGAGGVLFPTVTPRTIEPDLEARAAGPSRTGRAPCRKIPRANACLSHQPQRCLSALLMFKICYRRRFAGSVPRAPQSSFRLDGRHGEPPHGSAEPLWSAAIA